MAKHAIDSFEHEIAFEFLCDSCGKAVEGYTIGTGAIKDGSAVELFVSVVRAKAFRIPYGPVVVRCDKCLGEHGDPC